MDIPASFRERLLICLQESVAQRGFSSSEFFKKWFLGEGSAYFFLFRKNLRVTNIQFAELIALLRVHVHMIGGSQAGELQFVSTHHLRVWVEEIVDTLNPEHTKTGFETIVTLYAEILFRTLIVDPLFTSSSVYIPPCLGADIMRICGESGYIHSCGRNIFMRKIAKTHKEHLFNSLDEYLSRQNTQGLKLFFAVYSHEDFTPHDRHLESELRHGLDEVKIYIEKFYMGSSRLVTVLREMRDRYLNQLVLPDAGDFRKKHSERRNLPDVDKSKTLWLIKDTGIDLETVTEGTEQFFICYEQFFLNENPFHLFDENKPAWISHTTIPHTLMGAMINLGRPGAPDPHRLVLADPFVGSGTTWLESLKLSAECRSSDLSPVAPLLTLDNLQFFSKSATELTELSQQLQSLRNYLESKDPQANNASLFPDSLADSYEWSFRHLTEFVGKEGTPPSDLVSQLRAKTLIDRIIFYLALRAWYRHAAAFERESSDWKNAYIRQLDILSYQLRHLISLRARQTEELVTMLPEGPNNIGVFQGAYSRSCSIRPKHLARCFARYDMTSPVQELDANELPPAAYHMIVTDPPYGFNTEDDAVSLATLWSNVIKKMIISLQEDGQLILCLPSRSHTGRNVQFFTQREFVIYQIVSIADALNREIVVHADVVPFSVKLFRPPYFWESERALRREILHFRFRTRKR